MNSHASTTPTNSRNAIIKRLSSQAGVIAALLSVFDVLTDEGQKNALVDCHELATDVSIDLSALIGGAA